jgi:hypothetical protein
MTTWPGAVRVSWLVGLATAALACQGAGRTFADIIDARDVVGDLTESVDLVDSLDAADAFPEFAGPDVADCDPACPIGQRCVGGACCPCPDVECDDGTHAEWVVDAWRCVDDPCSPGCLTRQHCERGACVENLCTDDVTNAECEAVGCICLADGSCGDCADCVPPCGPGSCCQVVDGVPTCTCCPDECPCGEHTEPGNQCVPNECFPACGQGECCAVDGGSAPDDCAVNECAIPCASSEYCDANGQCQPYLCDPACPVGEHCGPDSACVPDDTRPDDCGCDTEGPPVCDLTAYLADLSTDATYDNLCFAECAGKTNLVPGACQCSMTCTADELDSGPQCGLDCQSYANLCDLRCAGLGLHHPGTCEPGCCPCSCYDCADEPFKDPVCGSDGQTYASACELTLCHTGVSLAYPGACVPAECGCPEVPEPVCGVDGHTYANACALACAAVLMDHDGMCP